MSKPSMSVPVRILARLAVVVAICAMWQVYGKREIDVYPVFSKQVQKAMQCDVCEYVVVSAYRRVEQLAKSAQAKELRLHEGDVLNMMDDVCNPFVEHGEWIRFVALNVSTHGSESRKAVSFDTSILSYPSMCRRTCATVRVLCEEVLDSASADTLPLLLLQNYDKQNAHGGASNASDNSSFVKGMQDILVRVCDPLPECRNAVDIRARLAKLLSSKEGSSLRRDIDADAPQPVDEADIEVDRMIDKTQRVDKKRANVMSRDDLRRLWSAIASGDRDAAAAIDPGALDMSDEEFDELKNEIANMGPPRDWTKTRSPSRSFHNDDL